MLREERSAAAHARERLPHVTVAIGEQLAALLRDDLRHVPARRVLRALFIYSPLPLNGRALVRWQRVHRKETGRMTGEPVYRDHANPIVHRIALPIVPPRN